MTIVKMVWSKLALEVQRGKVPGQPARGWYVKNGVMWSAYELLEMSRCICKLWSGW